MECADEQATCHHRGVGHGFGPVQAGEQVVFAVFESTQRDGNRVKATAFLAKQLARRQFSMARIEHITKDEFEAKVIRVQLGRCGPLVGIALASVAALRALKYLFENAEFRSVCVTDHVTEQDFDAHAALGYAESHQRIPEPKRPKIRAKIHADLADSSANCYQSARSSLVTAVHHPRPARVDVWGCTPGPRFPQSRCRKIVAELQMRLRTFVPHRCLSHLRPACWHTRATRGSLVLPDLDSGTDFRHRD